MSKNLYNRGNDVFWGYSVEKRRYDYIDWAKAIGICLICIGHFLPRGNDFKIILYSFHVPIFVFVSGLLTRAPSGALDCLKKIGKLLIRVGIPYTLWHTVSSIVYIAMGEKTWVDAIKTYFFLEGKTIWNDALWYAPVFIIVAILFYLICYAVRGNVLTVLSLSVAAFAGFVTLEKLDVTVTAFGFKNFLSVSNLLLFFAFLCLGFACRGVVQRIVEWKDSPRKNPIAWSAAAVFLVCAVLVKLLNHGDRISLLYGDYNDPLSFSCFAVVMTFCFVIACSLFPSNRAARMFSRNSLFLMCSHFFIYKFAFANRFAKAGIEMFGFNTAVTVLLLYFFFLLLLEKLCARAPAFARILEPLGIEIEKK